MKIFECGNCFHPLYFENSSCEKCGNQVGFLENDLDLKSFDSSFYSISSKEKGVTFRYCENYKFGVCNWMIPQDGPSEFCLACSLNRTIPDLSDQENFEKWKKLESAKHRLVYQLLRLGLLNSNSNPENPTPLLFDFIAKQGNPDINTGHQNGLITILLSEADSVHREFMRKQMSEQYRTLIGHFRHEVGHYYWDQLIAGQEDELQGFRKLFGDERLDYGQALQNHYQNGAPTNWQQNYISQYATAHPWEDWAETWAHYLHIMDMSETAFYFGLSVQPLIKESSLKGKISFDPYDIQQFDKIYKTWAPVSFAINSLNRGMGIPDAYPFVVSAAVLDKMIFIHRLVSQ
ncbi:putative zinc-binding peptidase [Algoriphagus aestuarii]|nr:putative zinc-binding peptidase [Algoriphagus aestuarii]